MFHLRAAERHVYGPIDIWSRASVCALRVIGVTSPFHSLTLNPGFERNGLSATVTIVPITFKTDPCLASLDEP